jgi:hypothetical protein
VARVLSQEVISRFQLVENRLDVLNTNLVSIDIRLPGLSKAIGVEQSKQKGDLVERVTKLENVNPAA